MTKKNTTEGIRTSELCAENKKYLSRLLVGKTGINPDFLTWDLLLTEKLKLDFFVATGKENVEQLIKARTEWNQLLKENKLKSAIENKLIMIECQNRQKEHIHSRKQQQDLRHKKNGLIALGLLTTLVIGYSYALPLLLGTVAAFASALCLAVSATLICCCSIVPAFIRERLIDPEWYKGYTSEKEEYRQIITQKIKGLSATEVAKEETQQVIINPLSIQKNPIELNQIGALTNETLTTLNNGDPLKKPGNNEHPFFFKKTKTADFKNATATQVIIHSLEKFI